MTTITPFAAGSYVSNRNTTQLLSLKNQLNDLSSQLASGQVSQTYGGLGIGRSTALAAQGTLSALTGYAAGITAAQTRTNLAVTSLTQVATLGTSTLTTLNNGLQSTPVDSTAAQSTAFSNLQAAFDALDQSAAGNFLFGGSNTTTQPVLDADTILNGTTNSDGTTKDGLKQIVSDQVKADVGPAGTGYLTTTQPTSTSVQLAETTNNAVRGTFGFTIGALPTTTGSAIKASYTAGSDTSAGSFTLSLAAQPVAGDSVTVALKMPDGTSTTLTFTAATNADASSSTSFAIGADAATTAANLATTLNNAVTAAAGSTLTVNATARGATNFFTGSASAGTIPQRIAFDTGGTPTGYVPGTTTNTVQWYQGEDSKTDPRATQSVQVSATSSIGTGVRANEPEIRSLLTGLATVAYGLPTTSSTTTGATYEAVANQAGALLSSTGQTSSVQDIVTQLSVGATRLDSASTTNAATQNTLQSTLDGIEQAPTEEVAVKLMDLQNRLQASYQVTASLSKLSLVNYIS